MNYKFDGSKVFFTSDTHFYHENIIRFCNRPFKDAEMIIQSVRMTQSFIWAISVLAVQPNGLKSLTG